MVDTNKSGTRTTTNGVFPVERANGNGGNWGNGHHRASPADPRTADTADNDGNTQRIRSFRERIGDTIAGAAEPADTPAPKTRKPRTRRGVGAPSQWGGLIGQGLGALTDVLAIQRGAHWKIKQERLNDVGTAWGGVIDHYFPDDKLGESALLTAAVVTTGVVFAPPLVTDMMQTAIKQRVPRAPQPPPSYTAPAAPPYTQPGSPVYGTVEVPLATPNPGDLGQMSEADFAAIAAQAQIILQSLFGGAAEPDTGAE